MNAKPLVNPSALEPLFEPWEEPTAHRVRADEAGKAAKKVKHRRPSSIAIAQNLRSDIRDWREAFYAGASDTTTTLFNHWFNRPHRKTTPVGEEYEFRYYFCQREAIETLVYLKEVRKLETLSQVISEYGGPQAEVAALGITEEEDAWSRYAFKMATGAGKTKVMSLAIVWSYFHALRESDSEMAMHFVVIAPNLTVFERLKEDFGGSTIFDGKDSDPLIPHEWRGDWNLSVKLQDDAGGATSGGVLYLTNIHRLYDMSKRQRKREEETYPWMGPPVSKATALDTAEALRKQITGHNRVMVLNDEAHHVWDPGSAWNEAINYLHNTIHGKTGGGIVAQLDFSATPKDNKGQLFKHIICDSPLGEAVDAGIVKTPIIGTVGNLVPQLSDDAGVRFDQHLRIGYERWKASHDEWRSSGKKALMFVMCEDTKAADEITRRLNSESTFKELNRRTINLHTNLKGRIKPIGKGKQKRLEFVVNDKEISDEDLKALRKLSRELDQNESPYQCIVSVLMLREGWDVRNVTTIVPLRAYSSKANILPEQTLGRGLRRMYPTGQTHELVTVVEHPAFASLYQQELAQEGLPIIIVDSDQIPRTTVSIFPDSDKCTPELEIRIPQLTAAHRTLPKIEGLTFEDVKDSFKKYTRLPVGGEAKTKLDYEGKHLITGEIVEKMKINLSLLETGVGAVSFYVKELELVCKLRGTHSVLAPLLQKFIEEVMFETKINIFDPKIVPRLAMPDVREHVRATFVPLIRKKTVTKETRVKEAESQSLFDWKPFQVTASENRPVLVAEKTPFNLVPCSNSFEQGFAQFADFASDVSAFAKNTGPQCLRIDYLTTGSRLSFYTPDFFVKTKENEYYLVETKGKRDVDVSLKARAAVAWCESATNGSKWKYLYVPQAEFERIETDEINQLAGACNPALQELLRDVDKEQTQLDLYTAETKDDLKAIAEFLPVDVFKKLPERFRRAIEQAIKIFSIFENKKGQSLAPAFQPLLGSIDEAAKGLIIRRLSDDVPSNPVEQDNFFAPYLGNMPGKKKGHLNKNAINLKKTLVYRNGLWPMGLLAFCLNFGIEGEFNLGGIFDSIKSHFVAKTDKTLYHSVESINQFRNMYIAHSEKELTETRKAKDGLRSWIEAIYTLTNA